jgi:serine/threonine protein kinase
MMSDDSTSIPGGQASTATASRCERCHAPLRPNEITGSCPRCLEQDMASEDGESWWSEEADRLPGLPVNTPLIDAWSGFELGPEIGRGGMGLVFRATQRSLTRQVAIKVLSIDWMPRPGARERLLAEAETLAELSHPGILPLYASGEKDGRPWLAMMLATGGTLSQRRHEWRERWLEIAQLVAKIADAVHYAHGRGVIHRDLKPANILFDEAARPYVCDFGLAKWMDTEGGQTVSLDVLGTPAYLSPEVAQGGARLATTSSDIYGLGAILYEMLTGQAPFSGATPVETARKVITEPLAAPRSIRRNIPPDLETIVLHAMNFDPGQRYASAADLAQDLRNYCGDFPLIARVASPWDKAVRWSRRHPLSAALVATMAIVVGIGSGLVWRSYRQEKEARSLLEERITFMTRELPPKLEPLGRLDVLDGVFANVDAYYRRLASSDIGTSTHGLARQADFHTQWAAILKPRGRFDEAETHLNTAVTLAAASAQSGSSPEAWAAIATAEHHLVELSTLKDDFSVAENQGQHGLAALATGLAHFPHSAELWIAKASLLAQMGTTQRYKKDSLKAEEFFQQSRVALSQVGDWERLPDATLRRRAWKLKLEQEYNMGTLRYGENDLVRAAEHLRLYKDAAEAEALKHPDDIEAEIRVAGAYNEYASALCGLPSPDMDQLAALFQRSESLWVGIAARDPGNLEYRVNLGLSAQAMAHLEKDRHNDPACRRWFEISLERFATIPNNQSLDFMKGRSFTLDRLLELLVRTDDWQAGRARCLEAFEASWDLLITQASLYSAHDEHEHSFRSAWDCWVDREPVADSMDRIRQWISRADAAAAAPGASRWWLLTQAMLHRRLADLARRENQDALALEENLIAFRLRASLYTRLPSPLHASDISHDIRVAGREIADLASSPEIIEDTLRTVFSLMPACHQHDAKSRRRWAEYVVARLTSVRPENRLPLAMQAIHHLYPTEENLTPEERKALEDLRNPHE